jgi:hypothetical protein
MPAASQIKVVLTPDVPGGFRPDTFTHLLQRQVHVPGLDRGYLHTLIAAAVAEDGDSAELTIHSQAYAAKSLDRGIRFLNGTPPAHVRVFHHEATGEGEHLAEVQLPAPLRQGQRVELGGQEFVVQRHSWPGRCPERGVCEGDVDWQHAHLVPVEPVSMMPTPAQVVPDGPLVAGAAARRPAAP